MKELLEKFNIEYDFLYQNGDYIAGYDEAINFFDDEMAKSYFKNLVTDFASYRNDFISSDREAAAFVFACESLNLLR